MNTYNSNRNIINQLYNLINFYEKKKQSLKNEPQESKKYQFKISSIKKGLEQIKQFPYLILSTNDIANLPSIGKGILQRVEEILNTGKLSEIENIDITLNSNTKPEQYNIIDDLKRITGIGPVNARKLAEKGITLEKLVKELKKNNNDINNIADNDILSLLTHHQLVGLKYFEDIEKRIPRKEIEEFEKTLQQILYNSFSRDVLFEICGSFRRGTTDSGDMDILISHPKLKDLDTINEEKILNYFVKKLIDNKIIVDNLTNDGNTKYMGVCKLNKNSIARRIDIRCVPINSFIPSLLYFTGSKKHNVELRKLCLKKNMRLSEYNLLNLDDNTEIILSSEKDLYKILSLDYVPPNKR